MKCDKCGAEITSGHRCPGCGASMVQKPGTAAIAIEAPKRKLDVVGLISPKGGFWNFDVLITKTYIKYVFMLGCAVIALLSLAIVIAGAVQGKFLGFIAGLFGAAVFGMLAFLIFRLACEGLIIFFKIHEELQSISRDRNQSS